MPRARLRAPLLRQVEFYLKDSDMVGLTCTPSGNGQTEPKECGGKVDAAKRYTGVYPNLWPDVSLQIYHRRHDHHFFSIYMKSMFEGVKCRNTQFTSIYDNKPENETSIPFTT